MRTPDDDVFSLCVHEILAVELPLSGGGIPCEGNTRGAVVAHVSVNHGLNVDGCTPLVGNAVDVAVYDGPRAVPGSEDGAQAPPHLLHRVFGKGATGATFDDGFEVGRELLEVVGRQLCIERDATTGLDSVDGNFKRVVFHAPGGYAHHDVAISLDESSVGVPNEPFVAGFIDESFGDFVVQPEVEDRFHHSRHGDACARPDRKKEWVVGVPELATHHFFDLLDVRFHLLFELSRVGFPVCVVIGADFRRYGEAGWYGESDTRHFTQVCTLATQQIAHLPLAIRLPVTKKVDELLAG